jgi:hypothetical protein
MKVADRKSMTFRYSNGGYREEVVKYLMWEIGKSLSDSQKNLTGPSNTSMIPLKIIKIRPQ